MSSLLQAAHQPETNAEIYDGIARGRQLHAQAFDRLFGGIGKLAGRAWRAAKDMHRRQSEMATLYAMSDRELRDIGLSRGEIYYAVMGGPREGLVRRLARKAGASFAEWRRRQVTRHQLMALDDRTLEDIGLTRGDIEAAVRGVPVGRLSANENLRPTANDDSPRHAA